MGFMNEKFDKEKESAQKAIETEKREQTEAIRAAVTAAIEPLQREITSLKKEVRELVTEKPNVATEIQYNLDDRTKKEISELTASVAAGLESYKMPIHSLFCIVVLLAGSLFWMSHKLNETAESMDWKYDVVTGILSGDREYWWNGENYEASRKAPEAKRLQEALDNYKKISEQMKKQAGKP